MAASDRATTDGNRPENSWNPRDCAAGGNARCPELKDWGAAWETWGRRLLQEIDEMRLAVCNLEKQVYYGAQVNKGTICDQRGPIQTGGGGPPTGTTQPPKPPFK